MNVQEPSQTDRTAGEIDWPPMFERTPAARRKYTSKFSKTFHQSLDDIEKQLDMMGADAYRFSTDAPHRKKDGRPYADSSPSDPAVVVRWTMKGEQYAIGCDHYTDVRDNARAIALYLHEKRKMSDRPVVSGEAEFSNLRLPAGDAVVATAPPREVLGLPPDADAETARQRARELIVETHPDQNGDSERYAEVKAAYNQIKNEL